MLPPTSPQYAQSQYGIPSQASRGLPPPFARESLNQGTSHRPGSSMSISSMLGSDAEPAARDQSSSRTNVQGSTAPQPLTPSQPPPRQYVPGAQQPRTISPDPYQSWESDQDRRSRAFSGSTTGVPSAYRVSTPDRYQYSSSRELRAHHNQQYDNPDHQAAHHESNEGSRRMSVGSLSTSHQDRSVGPPHRLEDYIFSQDGHPPPSMPNRPTTLRLEDGSTSNVASLDLQEHPTSGRNHVHRGTTYASSSQRNNGTESPGSARDKHLGLQSANYSLMSPPHQKWLPSTSGSRRWT